MIGEIITIGKATLYHGDCREILPTLQKVDLVLTDPPYGIGESSRKNATRGKPFGSRIDSKNTRGTYVAPTDYGIYSWDTAPPDPELLEMVLDAGVCCCLWGGNYFGLPAAPKWLVWDKINSGDFADCELAWTNFGGAVRIFRHMWNGMLRASERQRPREHPTQKPIEVMRWSIEKIPGAPETILDPFMGSGTTLVACQKLGRHGIGIEIDPEYFEIACRRVDEAARQPDLFIAPTPKPIQEGFDL